MASGILLCLPLHKSVIVVQATLILDGLDISGGLLSFFVNQSLSDRLQYIGLYRFVVGRARVSLYSAVEYPTASSAMHYPLHSFMHHARSVRQHQALARLFHQQYSRPFRDPLTNGFLLCHVRDW